MYGENEYNMIFWGKNELKIINNKKKHQTKKTKHHMFQKQLKLKHNIFASDFIRLR